MSQQFSKSKLSSRFVALLLCFWLSGAVCVLACGTAAQTEKTSVAGASTCPMHNHQAAEADSQTNSKTANFSEHQNHAPKMNCCAFGYFLTNSAQTSGQTNLSFAAATAAPVKFNFPANARREISFPRIYQTIPRTRGDTYLRNRVFRI